REARCAPVVSSAACAPASRRRDGGLRTPSVAVTLMSVLATAYSGSALGWAEGVGCRRRAERREGTITTSGATPRTARRTPHPALPTSTSASTGQTAFKSAGTLRHGTISTREGEPRE